MTTPELIRSTLVNLTNAACSEQKAKNNRWHYRLRFEESIGVDWLYEQVRKTSLECDRKLEVYEIHPSGVGDFEIEIRELERREGIDANQRDFSEFTP
jgi:hypothetical protein